MKAVTDSTPRKTRKAASRPIPQPVIFLLVLAACGWLILIANMFGFAGLSGWIFPVVEDIPGLAASTILIALLGLTPLALRHLRGKKSQRP
ncbi:MAG: hypothetical protein R6V45_09920 [Oceanipulchritudo sp.]